MPGPAHRTSFELPEMSDTLVIHCSDPRFQPHFQAFLRDHYGLERYALIAVPGGPQMLTLSDYLPKFAWTGWRWVKFMAELAGTTHVILITHEDCRWYADARFAALGPGDHAHQLQDLQQLKEAFKSRFANLRIDACMARLEGSRVAFEIV